MFLDKISFDVVIKIYIQAKNKRQNPNTPKQSFQFEFPSDMATSRNVNQLK